MTGLIYHLLIYHSTSLINCSVEKSYLKISLNMKYLRIGRFHVNFRDFLVNFECFLIKLKWNLFLSEYFLNYRFLGLKNQKYFQFQFSNFLTCCALLVISIKFRSVPQTVI